MINGLYCIEAGKAAVVIDGQFGSTGKGSIAALIGMTEHTDVAVTNAAPNSGHTAILSDGTVLVTRHLPMAGVVSYRRGHQATIYLDAGSVIDADVLIEECRTLSVDPGCVFIHPRAALITTLDKEYENDDESAATALASTRKGVGRALALKVMRESPLAYTGTAIINSEYEEHRLSLCEAGFRFEVLDLNSLLLKGERVLIEVPQGFDLSLNHGLSYPHCTSRDVTVASALSDAGVHPKFLGQVVMTTRTFPIRVGHIVHDGVIAGHSGPHYPDQKELTWDDLPVEGPELTTVTKRPRRIFTWSDTQYVNALRALRPDVVFLNFTNYFKDEAAFDAHVRRMYATQRSERFEPRHVFGVGPTVDDIVLASHQVTARMGWRS